MFIFPQCSSMSMMSVWFVAAFRNCNYSWFVIDGIGRDICLIWLPTEKLADYFYFSKECCFLFTSGFSEIIWLNSSFAWGKMAVLIIALDRITEAKTWWLISLIDHATWVKLSSGIVHDLYCIMIRKYEYSVCWHNVTTFFLKESHAWCVKFDFICKDFLNNMNVSCFTHTYYVICSHVGDKQQTFARPFRTDKLYRVCIKCSSFVVVNQCYCLLLFEKYKQL